MARTTLTPTLLTADQAAANLTALAAAGVAPGGTGAGNGVLFTNYGPGQTLLLVSVGSTATTFTVAVGSTLFNQAATGFSVVGTVSALNLLGPFHSALDQQGTSQVAVDFSNVTSVLCAVLQLSGVY
jgi:hypothetical protein